MCDAPLDHRSFLAGTAGSLAPAASASASGAPFTSAPAKRAASTSPGGRIRLGAPVRVEGDDPEELARAHREKGYRAGYCPAISLDDSDRVEATSRAFARRDVVIAEVGRWVNLLAPEPEERRQNVQIVTDGLALAEAVGARCCVDIAGSFNPDSWFGPHPENLSERFFDAAVENARAIIDAVRPKRTTFCYEMMATSARCAPARAASTTPCSSPSTRSTPRMHRSCSSTCPTRPSTTPRATTSSRSGRTSASGSSEAYVPRPPADDRRLATSSPSSPSPGAADPRRPGDEPSSSSTAHAQLRRVSRGRQP